MRTTHMRLLYTFVISLIILTMTSVWLANVYAGGPWFVSPAGSDASDCLTLATACKTVAAAMLKASSNDIIVVAGGTYTEGLTIDKDLTLIGFGSDATTLSGGKSQRVVTVTSGVSARIYDLAIVDGNAGALSGGGILNLGNLTLTRVLLSGNAAESGAGIWTSGHAALDYVFVTANSALCSGGGIENTGALSLSRSVLSENTAACGGAGIENDFGSLIASNSIITGNLLVCGANNVLFASRLIYLAEEPAIRASPSAGCGPAFGAGIDNFGGYISLDSSAISSNVSIGFGGGVWSQGGMITVTNAIVADNQSNDQGAGLYNAVQGAMKLTNVTIGGNSSVLFHSGGGIVNAGALTITNSTIATNRASNGSNVYNTAIIWPYNTIIVDGLGSANCANSGGVIISSGHNLDSGNTCDFTAAGDLTNTNPLLGPLQDNGGPTPTYALPANSPAVNAGDNFGCPATDQRGIARPQAGRCDIGAYEYVFPVELYLPVIAR